MAGITGTLISSHWVFSTAVICKLCGDHIICSCKSKAGQHSRPHACDALSCLLGNFCYNCLGGFCAEKYEKEKLFALRFVLYYSSFYPNILEPRFYSRSSLPRYLVISAPKSQGWLPSHVWSTSSILPYFPPWKTHEEGGAIEANWSGSPRESELQRVKSIRGIWDSHGFGGGKNGGTEVSLTVDTRVRGGMLQRFLRRETLHWTGYDCILWPFLCQFRWFWCSWRTKWCETTRQNLQLPSGLNEGKGLLY